MRVLWAALASLVLFGLPPARAAADGFEAAVLAELNYARTHPGDYMQRLGGEGDAPYEGGYAAPAAAEDPDALAEAMDFLQRQQPLAPLRPDRGLAAAALDHVAAQGLSRAVGHGGGDDALGVRLRRARVGAGLTAEDISYGQATPHDVVRQLIIDSGVPGRGHRLNIFDPYFEAAGVSCGRHRLYGAMCVIDFGGAFVSR